MNTTEEAKKEFEDMIIVESLGLEYDHEKIRSVKCYGKDAVKKMIYFNNERYKRHILPEYITIDYYYFDDWREFLKGLSSHDMFVEYETFETAFRVRMIYPQ